MPVNAAQTAVLLPEQYYCLMAVLFLKQIVNGKPSDCLRTKKDRTAVL